MSEGHQNWAGNYVYAADRVRDVAGVDDIVECVRSSPRVKALGTRHSFNDIADSQAGMLISIGKLNRVLSLDTTRRTVTVQGGIPYGALARELHQSGWALHNLASLPHISVAGASATATHGSGQRNGNLATTVTGMKIVTGKGVEESFSLETHPNEFPGMVVNLGAMGVVTELTLQIEPSFAVRQEVYLDLPMEALRECFDELMGSAYSVSLFTDWRSGKIDQVWCKRRDEDAGHSTLDPRTYGAKPATRPMHPIASMPAENCTQQLGISGPWHERLPHFRMEFTPSAGEELQSEYFVPRRFATDAIQAVHALREHISPLLQISEIRAIAGDELWMSPCYRQRGGCVAIHFTWLKNWPAVRPVLVLIEQALQPFEARPHWGKLFTTDARPLAALYPRLSDFRSLSGTLDPEGKFANAFLHRCGIRDR